MMIGLGISPFRSGGQSWSSYWATLTKASWIKKDSRSGLILVDSIDTDNNVNIHLACMETGAPTQAGGTGCIKTGIVPDANTILVLRGAITSIADEGNGSGFYIKMEEYGGVRWGFKWGDKDGLSHVNRSGTSSVLADANWHTFIIYDKRFWLLDPDVELTDSSILNIIATATPLINITTAAWVEQTNQIILLSNYAVNYAARAKRSITWIGNISDGVITWQKKYTFTTNKDVFDILGNGTKVAILTNAGGTNLANPPLISYSEYGYDTLTLGHTLAYLAGTGIISIPKADNGFITDMPTGYVTIQEMDGDVLNHNQADSKLRFALGSLWDRSDTDVWSDDCRSASDYDAINPTDWHISNINALQLYEWLNADYKYILGCKFDPNSVDIEDRLILEELFTFPTNLTETEMHKVWKYTGDYNLIVI